MSKFQTGNVRTTQGASGLPYSESAVFSEEAVTVSPEERDELLVNVAVTAEPGQIVQLPNGFPAANGDTVALTVDEFKALGRFATEVAAAGSPDTILEVGTTPAIEEDGAISEAPESIVTITHSHS